MSNLRFDIATLERDISNLLVTYPELAEDDILRADMFEAETSLLDVLAACVDREREAKAMAGAVKERISDLSARKARYERQQDAWRDLIQKLMDHAGQAKISLPEATLSVSHRQPEPVIFDEDALPDECVKTIRAPDKATIRDWCKNGNIPDGVRLSNGRAVLTVRAK